MIRTSSIILAAALASAAGACERSAQEERDRAASAQREADEKIAQAKQESTTKITSAQVEADKKIAEANAQFSKTRDQYRQNLTKDLETADRKIERLENKAKVAEGKSKADLDAALSDIHARRQALSRDIPQLDGANMDSWDATKNRLDTDWTALKTALDKVPISEKELDTPAGRLRTPVTPP